MSSKLYLGAAQVPRVLDAVVAFVVMFAGSWYGRRMDWFSMDAPVRRTSPTNVGARNSSPQPHWLYGMLPSLTSGSP